MAAGSSSQKNLRKAIEAIKDSTSVGIAKVNSEYKDLSVSILKATNHDEVLPKEKHVRTILGAVSGSRPRADVAYCIHALTRRLAKTRTWVVALKALIVIHRALREVDYSFCEALMFHYRSRGHLLNLLHFKDESSPIAWDYSSWIRAYALYIEECLECFRVLKYDFHREHSRTKHFDTPTLHEQLPALQRLLFCSLGCQPAGAAQYNFIIQYALSIVSLESVRLYVAITDGVLVLVDKFFEMQHHDAIRTLEIYRKSVEQAQRLSEFFDMCRALEFGRRQKYVTIEQPPASFLKAMEEYIKDAPQTLRLPSDIKLIEGPGANLETDPEQVNTEEQSQPSADSQEGTNNEDSKADAAPLIPDLLSWDEPSQESSEVDEKNSLPNSIPNPENLLNPGEGPELSSQSDSWELVLYETSSNAASVTESKNTVPNVLDRSILDSLYDAALANPSTDGTFQASNAYTNPFETDCYNQEMFYDPSMAGHPSSMQLAIIPQQPAPLMQQQDHQQIQPMIGFDYMQIAGINRQQQPPPFAEQQQYQLQEPAFGDQSFMQMTELPQPEASMQQQHLQEKSMMGQPDSTNKPSGNPFVD